MRQLFSSSGNAFKTHRASHRRLLLAGKTVTLFSLITSPLAFVRVVTQRELVTVQMKVSTLSR